MAARWEAELDDGTRVREDGRPGGAYASIPRHRLRRFHIYADQYALAPAFSVDVPGGSRLVYRTRHVITAGEPERAYVLIGIERDGVPADVYVLADDGSGRRQLGWGDEEPFARPELLPCEAA